MTHSPNRATYDATAETMTIGVPQLVDVISQTLRQPRTLRAPRYTKERDLSEYLADFIRIADRNHWDNEEAGIELQNNLEGDALSCALAAPTTSLPDILAVLRERFIPTPQEARRTLQTLRMSQNDVNQLAAQCRRLTELGYGPQGLDIKPEKLEEQKIEAFIEGLHNRDMVHALGIQRPETLAEAVKLTKEFIRRDRQFTNKVRCIECNHCTSPEREQLPNQMKQLTTQTAVSGNE